MVFAAFPRSGPPPRFRNYQDYAEVIGQLEKTGCIADYTHIWWDIRLHPRYGTVEIRICDGVTRVEDAVALTAYCQSLVKLLSEQHDAGEEIPSYHRILTTENKWLAARYGLEAPIMDLVTGPPEPHPGGAARATDAARDRAARRELGCDRELEGIKRHPRPRQRRRPPAPRLQREPRHRRGRVGDRGRDRRGRDAPSRPRPPSRRASAPASSRSPRRTPPDARPRGARGPAVARAEAEADDPAPRAVRAADDPARAVEREQAPTRGEVQRPTVARDRGRRAAPPRRVGDPRRPEARHPRRPRAARGRAPRRRRAPGSRRTASSRTARA